MKNFEIAIIGGGIAGVTLAIGLHKRNVPCKVYEQASGFHEIGAGVAFSPNAIRAMLLCDPIVHEAFLKIRTSNKWPSREKVWFEHMDGEEGAGQEGNQANESNGVKVRSLFTVENDFGLAAVHRAHFLDEMVKHLPDTSAEFRKRLDNIEEDGNTGKLILKFHDGTTALADAVIGCDGIKSRVRGIIVGENHPSAKAGYTYKYAYRGVIPMNDAIETLGEDIAVNSCLWMGHDAHALTFPIAHGKLMNLFACATDSNEWPDESRLTLPATREEALHDFRGFGPSVKKLIQLTKEDLSRWGLFDLGKHPVPAFYKGRICISGDAAHATTPHHGAGAGFCIEDSAILCTILSDERVQSGADIEAGFKTFDRIRRERDQWIVQSSRRSAELIQWQSEDLGDDVSRIEAEIRERYKKIWGIDLDKEAQDAKEELSKVLGR